MTIESHGREHSVTISSDRMPLEAIHRDEDQSSDDETISEPAEEPVYTISQVTKKAKGTTKWQHFARNEHNRNAPQHTPYVRPKTPDESSKSSDEGYTSKRQVTYYRPSGNYSDDNDDFWEAYDADQKYYEEKELIKDAKARYWGTNWKEHDKKYPRSRAFWTDNLADTHEFRHRQEKHQLGYTWKGASQQERHDFNRKHQAATRERSGLPLW